MKQSSSWESDIRSDSQDISSILWDPKIHCRFHNIPPLETIFSQLNPIHIVFFLDSFQYYIPIYA
jgi:hypothetical protein